MSARRLGLRIAASGAAVAVFVALAPPMARAEVATARVVGSLPRYPREVLENYEIRGNLRDPFSEQKEGQVLLVPRHRLLVQVFTADIEGSSGTLMYLRDLDTLQGRGFIEIEGEPFSEGSEILHALDAVRGRLFVLAGNAVRSVDLLRRKVKEISLPVRFPPAFIQGMTYDGRTDRLYLVGAGPENAGIPGFVLAVRTDADEGEDPFVYLRVLRSCRGPYFRSLSPTDPRWTTPILSLQDAGGVWRLHIACLLRSSVGGVVAVAADDPNDPSEQVTTGPPLTFSALADVQSGRIMLVFAPDGTRVGAVYDAHAAAFVGVVSLRGLGQAQPYTLGWDETTGSLYGLSASLGFFTTTLRLDPVPQPTTLAGFKGVGHVRIWVDPDTSRAFVLPSHQNQDGNWFASKRYTILEVPRASAPPPPSDPDRFTINHPEKLGVTSSTYTGTGSAYGVRILLARGVQGTPPAGESIVSVQPGSYAMRTTANKCGFTDRMLVVGVIGTSTLSDTSAGGSAGEIEVDASTKVDLQQPSRCDQDGAAALFGTDRLGGTEVGGMTVPSALDETAGTEWAYRPAECDAADDQASSSHPDDAPSFGEATITCAFGDQRLEAIAHGRLELPGVRIASARSTVTTSRTFGKGITVRTEASVDGIDLGEVRIGRVRSVAEVRTGGTRGSANASFVRELSGVVAPGLPSSVPRSCQNQGCEELLARINVALSGRAEFRLSQPDPDLCRTRDPADGTCTGTPGGAQAGILKSVFRRASDNSMSGDSSWEVPGLELLVYNDNADTGRARQLFQFAGVRADATYHISLLPTGSGFDPVPPTTVPPVIGEPERVDATPAVPGQAEPPASPVQRIVQPIADGLRFLFASPVHAARAATVWLLLLGPLALAIRRKRLASIDDEGGTH